MQVIRAYWTDITHWNASFLMQGGFIKNAPEHNEVVYVWDIQTKNMLEARGYETRLMEEDPFGMDGFVYGRKLQAFNEALKEFGEVLLLDWDMKFLVPIDDEFIEELRSAPSGIQIPLYAQEGATYGWEHEGVRYSPCFCFVYCNRPELGPQLLRTQQNHHISGCVEEHCMAHWAKKYSLDEFIDAYHPKMIHGVHTPDLPDPDWMGGQYHRVVEYVEQRKQMSIKALHTKQQL